MGSSRDDVLRRVQALLSKADSTTFDEERDALLAKADDLMLKYAIESYEIDKARNFAHRQESVVLREVEMVEYDHPVARTLIDLMSDVTRHLRCRVAYAGAYRGGKVRAKVVGFESDTEFVEMLYTSLWLQMTNHLEPKPDPDLSIEENVVMLLENGQKRERVCQLLGWDYQKDHGKVSKIYRDYCEANGQSYTPRSRPTGSTYAQNFARGFVSRVSLRFYEMDKVREESANGSAIVLRDRNKEVSDAYKEFFPHLGTMRRRAEGKFNATARERGDTAGRKADLGQPRVRSSKALGR